MLHALLSGIGFGLMLSFVPGPVFFALLQTGINKGFRYGIFFALGVALSDICFIVLTWYGVSGLFHNALLRKIVGVAGGVFMCLFGAYYIFLKPQKSVPYKPVAKERGLIHFMIKGFALNIINPFVLFFWIGMVSAITIEFEYQKLIFAFFIASVSAVFCIDILKSFVANLIKSFFTETFLIVINKVLGVILFGIGIRLMVKALSNSLHI